jgi:ribosome biogenesis protein BMS1
MKTMGQLKREQNIKAEVNEDHLYTKIERTMPTFRPLKIPAALQKALPYNFKAKNSALNPKASFEANRVAVINSPHEQKVAKMMKMLKANYEAKEEKRKAVSNVKYIEKVKKKQKEEINQVQKQKDMKRKIFRALSKIQAKNDRNDSKMAKGKKQHSFKKNVKKSKN